MKKFIAFLTAAMMIMTVCVSAKYSEDDLTKTVDEAVAWKNSNASPYYNSGTEAADLYIFALKRLGVEYDYERYSDNMRSVLGNYGSNRSAAVYARTILALEACGQDAGYFNDRNFVGEGTYDKDNISGADDWAWALIALDSKDYGVPEGSRNSREDIIKHIMAAQNADGSIGRSVSSTAVAVIALSEYTYDEKVYTYTNAETGGEESANAWEIVSAALEYLSKEQSDWGDYYDLKTTALVLIALDYMDIDVDNDGRFVKDGKTVVDGLLVYKLGDGSFSSDMNDSDSTATTYAICALTSHLRQIQGRAKLFDMTSNDTVEGVKHNINSSSSSNNSGSNNSGSSSSSGSSGSSSGSSSSSSVSRPSSSATTRPKTTTAPKVQSTRRPAAATMSPISSAKPTMTPKPRKKALVGPVKMPGPMQVTPEPAEDFETDNLNNSNKKGSASRSLPIGIAMLAAAALITAGGVTYVIRTSRDIPLPKKDRYKAKIHRRTEIHGRYKKRGKYKERGKYKGSYRK